MLLNTWLGCPRSGAFFLFKHFIIVNYYRYLVTPQVDGRVVYLLAIFDLNVAG